MGLNGKLTIFKQKKGIVYVYVAVAVTVTGVVFGNELVVVAIPATAVAVVVVPLPKLNVTGPSNDVLEHVAVYVTISTPTTGLGLLCVKVSVA